MNENILDNCSWHPIGPCRFLGRLDRPFLLRLAGKIGLDPIQLGTFLRVPSAKVQIFKSEVPKDPVTQTLKVLKHLLSSCSQEGCCNQNCGICREQCRGGCSYCMSSDPCKMSCNHILSVPKRQLVLVCRDTWLGHTRPRQASIYFPLGAVGMVEVLYSFCPS